MFCYSYTGIGIGGIVPKECGKTVITDGYFPWFLASIYTSTYLVRIVNSDMELQNTQHGKLTFYHTVFKLPVLGADFKRRTLFVTAPGIGNKKIGYKIIYK